MLSKVDVPRSVQYLLCTITRVVDQKLILQVFGLNNIKLEFEQSCKHTLLLLQNLFANNVSCNLILNDIFLFMRFNKNINLANRAHTVLYKILLN